MERVEALVIGAGVVGLAAARALARAGREVVVAEAGPAIGGGVSSRNSEVVHAGIYYPAGSLKARLCVAGRTALYEYCRARGVAHRRTGKLIVAASPDQIPALEALRRRAAANGVTDLEMISAAEATALEPALACTAALVSPSTGIVDSHGLMLALQGEAEDHGAMVAFNAPVLAGRVGEDRLEVTVGGAAPMRLACDVLVNAAGLDAWSVARAIDGLPPASVPAGWRAKGSYFALAAGRAPFERLIYPAPEDGGLGVHLTLDLAGRARFGPDVEWLAEGPLDYAVDPARADGFYAAIRRYWPGLPDGALRPDYSGVRPKLSGPRQPAADFAVLGPADHGVPGLVTLFGIESPGLTASLALADLVLDRLAAQGRRSLRRIGARRPPGAPRR